MSTDPHKKNTSDIEDVVYSHHIRAIGYAERETTGIK